MNDGKHSTTTSGRVPEACTKESQEEVGGSGATINDSDTSGEGRGKTPQAPGTRRQVDPGWDVVCSQPKR